MIINSYVLFYVLFLQIEAPSPLQSKGPKQSKQTSAYARMHIHAPAPPPPPPPNTHTCSQEDSLKRWDFKDVCLMISQGRLFQTDSAA